MKWTQTPFSLSKKAAVLLKCAQIGQALMERAVEWAKSKGFPGMMLETQSNNVAACRLYERCGFMLGGFDSYLYKALDPGTDEIALYWYLMF